MASGGLRWVLAAAMIVVSLFHLVRLVQTRSRPGSAGVDVELTHAAMGVVMTVMLVGSLSPGGIRPLAVAFAAALLWFLCRATHSYVMDGPGALGVSARQIVGCAAMVYMLVAVSGVGSSMPGMSMAGSPRSAGFTSPVVSGVLLASTIGVAVWTLSRPRLVGLPPPQPMLAAGCSLAMNATTVYMLLAL